MCWESHLLHTSRNNDRGIWSWCYSPYSICNITWWRHQKEICSALLALCAMNSQRPVTRSFDVFFDQRLNKRLSKQWWGWWFETPSCTLWRHSNDALVDNIHSNISHSGHVFFITTIALVIRGKFETSSSFITFSDRTQCTSPISTPPRKIQVMICNHDDANFLYMSDYKASFSLTVWSEWMETMYHRSSMGSPLSYILQLLFVLFGVLFHLPHTGNKN